MGMYSVAVLGEPTHWFKIYPLCTVGKLCLYSHKSRAFLLFYSFYLFRVALRFPICNGNLKCVISKEKKEKKEKRNNKRGRGREESIAHF